VNEPKIRAAVASCLRTLYRLDEHVVDAIARSHRRKRPSRRCGWRTIALARLDHFTATAAAEVCRAGGTVVSLDEVADALAVIDREFKLLVANVAPVLDDPDGTVTATANDLSAEFFASVAALTRLHPEAPLTAVPR